MPGDGPQAKPGPLPGLPDGAASGDRACDPGGGHPAVDGSVDEGAGAMLLSELLDATRRLTEGAMAAPDYEDRLRLLWGRWLDRVRDEGEG